MRPYPARTGAQGSHSNHNCGFLGCQSPQVEVREHTRPGAPTIVEEGLERLLLTTLDRFGPSRSTGVTVQIRTLQVRIGCFGNWNNFATGGI